MKRALVCSRLFFSLFILLSGITTVSAQQDNYGWRIGIGAGYMNYFGDLSPYQIGKWNEWDHVFRFFQYNKYYISEASYGISIERKLTPTTGLIFQANQGKISMSDRYREPNGDYNTNALHWNRALNFETTIQDVGAAFLFQSDNGRFLPLNAFFAPYVYLGGGITKFKVKGDLYDKNGDPYNYADPDLHPDGIYETVLRPLKTETAKEYPDLTGYADLGIGIKLRISHRVNLAIQTDIKYSFSDYLDDVSGRYKENYSSAGQAYAAHPGINIIDPVTGKRGNDNGVNDIYIFNKIALQYSFGQKRTHQFRAPVIYEPGLISYDQTTDTGNTREDTLRMTTDSLVALHRADSLRNSIKDTTPSVIKSPNRQIENTLNEIKGEMRSLRFAHIDQNYIIRKNVVEGEVTALLSRRDAIQNKSVKTKEDQLRYRLYNLQIDSLNHELTAIRKARMQLRQDMSYTPIITAYEDSAKIMIYKNNQSQQDTAYMPVIGQENKAPEVDTLSKTTKSIQLQDQSRKGKKERRQISEPSPHSSITAADSIRNELNLLQKSASEMNDTSYYQQLQKVKQRLDSLENRSNIDSSEATVIQSAYNRNQIKIAQDSAQAAYLSEKADSLYAVETLNKRNGIQRFFDKFKGRKNRSESDTIMKEYSQPDDSIYMNESIPAYNAETGNQVSDKTQTLLKNNQQEIEELNNEMRQLRRQNEISARQYPRIVYRNDNTAQEIRKERQAMERLNREMIRSNDRNRRNPVVTPNIILGTRTNDNYKEEFRDIQDQLAALKNSYELRRDTQVALLKDQLDSLQEQQHYTSAIVSTNARITPLQSQIDSLTKQLHDIQRQHADSMETGRTSIRPFALADFPVVSLYFATGSSQPNHTEIEKIRPVAEMALKYPENELLIKGYTDGTGNRMINQTLSAKRCNTVKNILINKYGLDADKLKTDSNVMPEIGRGNPLQRRVDLQFKK